MSFAAALLPRLCNGATREYPRAKYVKEGNDAGVMWRGKDRDKVSSMRFVAPRRLSGFRGEDNSILLACFPG